MGFFRRFMILLGVIGIGTFIFSYKEPTQVMGAASAALETFYDTKRADAVNSQKITIVRDGQTVLPATESKPYMTTRMELMVDVREAARLFRCDVDVLPDGSYNFTYDGRLMNTKLGENMYALGGEPQAYTDPLILYDQHTYVSVPLLARGFGMSYQWDAERNQALISTVSDTPDGVSDENGSLAEVQLPERYDMREDGRVNAVGSQGSLGTCWAFAALGALESSLLPDLQYQFSVDHMSFWSGFNTNQQDGGDFNMALAYLAAWKGPVLEKDDPYGDGVSYEYLPPVVHLQQAVTIGEKDYTAIKEMIYKTGGVQSSFYSDMETATSNSSYYNSQQFAYYYPGKNLANHDVVIIGWDDNYPKENFNVHPQNDGAFICRNSWGTAFGDSGYFYVSYEDTNIGVNNIVYTQAEAVDNYDHIYQSDLLGWIGTIGYGSDTAWFANVFQAEDTQNLAAVSFYTTGAENYYDVFIVRDFADSQSFGTMEYVKSGFIPASGYYTCRLAGDYLLNAGDDFAVIVRLTTVNSERPAAIEYETGELTSGVDISDGHGYLSYNGLTWERTEDVYNCNICLKAFTEKKQ